MCVAVMKAGVIFTLPDVPATEARVARTKSGNVKVKAKRKGRQNSPKIP